MVAQPVKELPLKKVPKSLSLTDRGKNFFDTVCKTY